MNFFEYWDRELNLPVYSQYKKEYQGVKDLEPVTD